MPWSVTSAFGRSRSLYERFVLMPVRNLGIDSQLAPKTPVAAASRAPGLADRRRDVPAVREGGNPPGRPDAKE